MLQVTVIFVLFAIAFLIFGKNVLPAHFDRMNTEGLRGIMALFIVGHHTGRVVDIPFISTFISSFEFGEMIVSVFFMLSGYGMSVSYKRKGKSYLDGFLKKRCSRILPVFLLLTVLSIVIFCCHGISLREQAVKLLKEGNPPLLFSWFIYAVLYVYVAFHISAAIAKTPVKTGLVFSGLILAYILVICQFTGWMTTWYATIPSAAVGYFMGLYDDTLSRGFRKALVVAVVLLCSSYVLVVKMTSLTDIPFFIWKYLWMMSESFAVYMLVRARVLGFIRWKLLIWIGAFSMELYLVHGMVIYFITGDFVKRGGVFMFCAVMVVSVAIAYILHRFVPVKRSERQIP